VLDIQSPSREGLYVAEKVPDSFVLGKYEKMLVATLEHVKLGNDLWLSASSEAPFPEPASLSLQRSLTLGLRAT
jgi:hypothetical protein